MELKTEAQPLRLFPIETTVSNAPPETPYAYRSISNAVSSQAVSLNENVTPAISMDGLTSIAVPS